MDSGEPVCSVDPEAARQQVARIVADPLFRNSKRYSGLLKFIVDRTLEGRHEDLKERIIGIEVFGRTPDYDTSLDATVRVTANEVRKRLSLYYKEPGREQQLRIDVPSGSYVAEFRTPELLEPPAPVAAPIVQQTRSRLGERARRYLLSAAAALILGLAAWAVSRAVTPAAFIDQFWAPALGGRSPAVLYLSSPIGASHSSASPNAASADSGEQFHEFLRKSRGQLPIADVNAASTLSSFLQRKGKESVIRQANGAALSDLRLAPAVLIGSYNNEWAMRLGNDLHFKFRRESELGLRWIEDSANPQDRKWAMDLSAPYGQVTEDYAVISRVMDPIAGRWVITIGGLSGSGTSAACEVLTDPSAMAALGANLPKNWANKNLQAVLAVKLVQGSPGASRVVATYSW